MDAAMASLDAPPPAAAPGSSAPVPAAAGIILEPVPLVSGTAPRPAGRADAATILIVIGRTLITLGLLIFGFVGYELLGTNIAEARHQAQLRGEARTLLGPAATPGELVQEVIESKPNQALAPPPPPEGAAVAVIKLPRIGVEKTVVEGVSLPDLKRGPGHYPGTPLPGQPGNAAIAGHRTTYGAPFFHIDEMRKGDPVFVTTQQGAFRYEVDAVDVVKPTDLSVVGPLDGAHLTLTSCNPRFSAAQRIVLHATLVGPAAAPPVETTVQVTNAPAAAARQARPLEVVGAVSDPKAKVPTLLYGAAAALIALAGWFLGRRWRRLPAYAIAAVPFGLALFFFYANLSRLVPS